MRTEPVWCGGGTDLPALFSGAPSLPESLGPILLVAAHPDDEVIGAGGQFHRLRNSLWFVHVTDGAPRNLLDARAAGCASRDEYARVRRGELREALSLAGIGPERCLTLGIADQESSFHLAGIARSLADILNRLRPALALSPPYEGGHPDHDAVAFAVQAAVKLLSRQGKASIPVMEYALYHIRGDRWARLKFLPVPGCGERMAVLRGEALALKHRMIDCFRSQKNVLEAFPRDVERFRPAPEYDFTGPPHSGGLLYERYDWGISGEQWRARATRALAELEKGGWP